MAMKKKKVNKTDIDTLKKINSIKNMYFNRYLMIRYFFAMFLFSNFYWALLSQGEWIIAVPITMMLLGVIPCIENIRSFGEKVNPMIWTKRFYQAQLIVNICLLLVVWTPIYKEVLPFLNGSLASQLSAFTMNLIGFLIAFACKKRLLKIDHNTDAQFSRIQTYEKALHLHY